MNKKVLVIGVILALLSVILGAFAAHGLKPRIPSESMESFQTGVRYQMYHALVLLIIGLTEKISLKTKRQILILITTGVLFFSGSIYLLSTNSLSPVDFKAIGFITPIGGGLLIISWIVLLVFIVKNRFDKN